MTAPPPIGELVVILVVDDSPLEQRYIARLLEGLGNWRLLFAHDGIEALEVLARETPAVVLTDVHMPRMDGLALVARVRVHYPQVPVVLMTANGDEQVAVEALKTGAADYVAKQALAHDLLPVLDRVMTLRQIEQRRYRVLAGMVRRNSRFVLDNDPALVPPLVALLREDLIEIGLCDLAGATRAGIALEEALLNAIYHGNLEVSSELRQHGDELFLRLVDERRRAEPYRQRRVRVLARLSPMRATFVVADEGPGFDVSRLPDPTDPSHIDRPCGRGILLMRAFMTEVRFNRLGNRVTLVKTRDHSGDER